MTHSLLSSCLKFINKRCSSASVMGCKSLNGIAAVSLHHGSPSLKKPHQWNQIRHYTSKNDSNLTFSSNEKPNISESYIEMQFANEAKKQKINSTWLRDHCKCPACMDTQTGQKLIRIAQLVKENPSAVQVQDAVINNDQVEITWKDGHKSQFHLKWLFMLTTKEARQNMLANTRMPTWDKSSMDGNIPEVNYEDIVDTETNETKDEGLLEWLEQLSQHGICLVNNVPTNATNKVNEFAGRIGYIQNSIYGPDWEVKVDPGHVNVAYTNIELGVHMDLCYYESPPGFQFLHCLQQAESGGENFAVDLYKIAEDLRKEHPQHFEALTKHRISFHNGSLYTNHVYYRRPLIEINQETNEIQSIFFSPYWEAPFNLDQEKASEFYDAYIKWNDMIREEKYVVEFKLHSGQVLSFNNRRVGHGRRTFDPTSPRHLQGTYVSTDEFANKYRMLRKNVGKKDYRLKHLGNASHEYCVEPMESV